MKARVEAFFGPSVRVSRKGRVRWRADLNKDWQLVEQFRNEAGLTGMGADPEDALDRLEKAAGEHGYCIEVLVDEILKPEEVA